jgi:hypothetical protein
VRRIAKTDANQPAIVDGLRAIGCSVQILAREGEGCPDLLVGYRGLNLLLEVKDDGQPPSKRRLTDDQGRWHADWNGQVATVENLEEAIAVVQIACKAV